MTASANFHPSTGQLPEISLSPPSPYEKLNQLLTCIMNSFFFGVHKTSRLHMCEILWQNDRK